jgi:hypothetical protein
LDFLAESDGEVAIDSILINLGIEPPSFNMDRDPRYDRSLVWIGNLERLGPCHTRPPDKALEQVMRSLEIRSFAVKPYTTVEMTDLGRTFVAACTPPRASPDG